ncbi:MAG: tRNA (N6-isopentenyl adenosine(37)-C2)-methylthiotransferase MiaB [Holophagaceae bacterium]|nr:tRNA (N6-isopentenyl adenosine(37)-C2)-methylthiotransferase MiaB [Holophagaceae bacterium]
MNDHDTEKMSGLLVRSGLLLADSVHDADLVLLNTCSIREKAAHKVYSELGRINEIKASRPDRPMAIGVTGCLAQQEKENIFKRAPFVDLVVGTMALKQLPRLVANVFGGGNHVIDTDFYPDNHLFPVDCISRSCSPKALITIIEGCNHACTYCVVPTTRGSERHRPVGDILTEVRNVVDSGFCEVELLGQNVNSYNGGCTFAELLYKIAEIDGLEWIRFTTSHPMNFTKELAQALTSISKVAPFLHMPIQSGSDKILRRMGRGYTAQEYIDRIGYLGERRNNMCLSTDFIVGFPGETDEDFESTMSILELIKFDASFSFIYSPRPDTPALHLADNLPESIKHERLARLQARQTEFTTQSNLREVGKIVPVRIESHTPSEQGYWLARTAQWRNVHIENSADSQLPFGRLVDVKITGAGPHWLKGEVL